MHDEVADRLLVHIIDDDESVRRSLDFMLRNAGFRTERWVSGDSFLKLADRSGTACVLLDVHLPGRDGLSVQKAMSQAGFNFPVIILTGHGDVELAVQAMRAGAQDFLEKPFERGRLLASLSQAFKSIGDQEALRGKAEWAATQLGKLTEREREVLDGLACGYPNKTIAFDLGISARTVEVYRANVMVKLQVGNFADALRIAFAAGLGSDADWRATHRVDLRLGSG